MLTFNLSYTGFTMCMELRETNIPIKMQSTYSWIMVRDKAIHSWTVHELACPMMTTPLLSVMCSIHTDVFFHALALIMDTLMSNPRQPARTVPIASLFPVKQNEIGNNTKQVNQIMAFVLYY